MNQATTSAITFSIAGMPVLITSPCPGILRHIRDTYGAFLSDEAPSFEISIAFSDAVSVTEFLSVPEDRIAAFLPASAFPGAPASRTDEHSRGAARPNISRHANRIVVQRHDFAAIIDTDKRRAKAAIRPKTEAISIESILRICCSFLAPESGCVLLHAGGVIRQNRGYAFPGPSGTGKSTIIGMAIPGDTVLSDEMIVVGREGREWYASSTPFFGTNKGVNRNIRSKLNAVFLPVKDTSVFLKQTSPREALRKLLVTVVSPGGRASMNQNVLDICADMVACVPFFELHFRKEDSFWKSIDSIQQEP